MADIENDAFLMRLTQEVITETVTVPATATLKGTSNYNDFSPLLYGWFDLNKLSSTPALLIAFIEAGSYYNGVYFNYTQTTPTSYSGASKSQIVLSESDILHESGNALSGYISSTFVLYIDTGKSVYNMLADKAYLITGYQYIRPCCGNTSYAGIYQYAVINLS